MSEIRALGPEHLHGRVAQPAPQHPTTRNINGPRPLRNGRDLDSSQLVVA